MDMYEPDLVMQVGELIPDREDGVRYSVKGGYRRKLRLQEQVEEQGVLEKVKDFLTAATVGTMVTAAVAAAASNVQTEEKKQMWVVIMSDGECSLFYKENKARLMAREMIDTPIVKGPLLLV